MLFLLTGSTLIFSRKNYFFWSVKFPLNTGLFIFVYILIFSYISYIFSQNFLKTGITEKILTDSFQRMAI